MGNSGADLAKEKDGKKVNSVSAQTRDGKSREPETGTGENIFDEQERDSADVKAVSNYRTKQFNLPDTDNPFSLLATDRDENGRIEHIALAISPETVIREYQYDGAGRLSKVTCGASVVEQYEYGKYGERLTGKTAKTKSHKYVYNEKLQLIQAGEVRYSYNSKGRLFMRTDRGQVTTYYYHDSGQLNEVRLPDGRKVTYIYDPLGRRVVKKINGNTIESYLWQDLVTLVAISDDQGMNMRVFTYDEDGNPVSMSYQDKMYHFATDQVGTIFAVANDKANTVKEIIHDSFGNLTFDSKAKFETRLGFAAGLLDADTGLIHFGYRDYDPAIGRFISPDPLGLDGGDVDVYGYCLDDPINFIDRTGLMAEAESEDEIPSNELSALKNGADRSTTGQADFKEEKPETNAATNKQVKNETAKNAVNPVQRTEKVDPSKHKFDPYIPGDLHKKVEDHLLKIGMDPSEIAYNSEGHPIVAYGGDGTIIPLKAEGIARGVKTGKPPKQAGADRGSASEPNRMEGLTSSTQQAAKLGSLENNRRDAQVGKILADQKKEKENEKKGKDEYKDTSFHKYEGIPVAPDGVSVDKNIQEARDFAKSVKGDVNGRKKKYEYLIDKYGSGKEKDYKKLGSNYERFGNFNFGTAANALGLFEEEAKAGAGVVQVRSGTWKAKWAGSYFDDPKDQYDIGKGFEYYKGKNPQ